MPGAPPPASRLPAMAAPRTLAAAAPASGKAKLTHPGKAILAGGPLRDADPRPTRLNEPVVLPGGPGTPRLRPTSGSGRGRGPCPQPVCLLSLRVAPLCLHQAARVGYEDLAGQSPGRGMDPRRGGRAVEQGSQGPDPGLRRRPGRWHRNLHHLPHRVCKDAATAGRALAPATLPWHW